jgi:hypothetical protein
MSERDLALALVLLLVVSVFALIVYAAWRGRNATAVDGDGDALWSRLVRVEATGLLAWAAFVVVFVSLSLPTWTLPVGLILVLAGSGLYAEKLAKSHSSSRGTGAQDSDRGAS